MKNKDFILLMTVLILLAVLIYSGFGCSSTKPVFVPPPIETAETIVYTDSGVLITFPVVCNEGKSFTMFFSKDNSPSVLPYTYQGEELK